MFFDRPDSGERAVLVHLNLASESEREDPREFEELVLSAGGDPVAFLMGARDAPHPRTFVGSGKLQEILDEQEPGLLVKKMMLEVARQEKLGDIQPA